MFEDMMGKDNLKVIEKTNNSITIYGLHKFFLLPNRDIVLKIEMDKITDDTI